MSVRVSPGKFFFLQTWSSLHFLEDSGLGHWENGWLAFSLPHERIIHTKTRSMQKIIKCRKYITINPRQFFRFPCLPHHETPLRNRTTTSLSASKKSPTYTFFGNQPEENIYIKKDQSKYWLKVREIKTRKNNKLNSGIDITFSKRRENYCIPHPSLEVTYV